MKDAVFDFSGDAALEPTDEVCGWPSASAPSECYLAAEPPRFTPSATINITDSHGGVAGAVADTLRLVCTVTTTSGQPGLSVSGCSNAVTGASVPKSDHAAIYYPYLQIGDPLTSGVRLCAPSGTVAGLYARTDASRGVWKAPAGTGAIS